jgi:hypothetical protein
MFRYIDNVRNKPESVRRHYAFGWSAAIVALMFFVWVGSLVIKYNSPVDQTATVAAGPSPISAVKDNIAQGYQQVKNTIQNAGSPIDTASQAVITADPTVSTNTTPAPVSSPHTDGQVIITDPGQ